LSECINSKASYKALMCALHVAHTNASG
jgi:hypothetical protein